MQPHLVAMDHGFDHPVELVGWGINGLGSAGAVVRRICFRSKPVGIDQNERPRKDDDDADKTGWLAFRVKTIITKHLPLCHAIHADSHTMTILGAQPIQTARV